MPGIPSNDKIDKWRYRHPAAAFEIELVKKPELRRLIDDAGDQGGAKADAHSAAPRNKSAARSAAPPRPCRPTPPPCAWRPIRAAPERRAASRRDIADRCRRRAIFSTNGRTCVRRHGAARRQRPSRRSSRNTSGGPSPSTNVASEVMQSSARSTSVACRKALDPRCRRLARLRARSRSAWRLAQVRARR